jgi:chemotaxis protein CheD
VAVGLADPTVLLANLGDVIVERGSAHRIGCYGVGSCVIVCAWDPATRVGGVAHVVVPGASTRAGGNTRHAEDAVEALVAGLRAAGAAPSRMVVKIAGGARMFGAGSGSLDAIGERNIASVGEALAARGLAVAARDVGGRCGRTVTFDPGTGELAVSTVGQTTVQL